MSTYVEYNNGKRPWSINASKICSNKDLYDENPNDISGLILEATYGDINISNRIAKLFFSTIIMNNKISHVYFFYFWQLVITILAQVFVIF